MKKIVLTISVLGMLSLASSCKKCNTCTDARFNELNHDYCGEIYRSGKTMDEAKAACEANGGTWAEK
jgi:hypothetical protein